MIIYLDNYSARSILGYCAISGCPLELLSPLRILYSYSLRLHIYPLSPCVEYISLASHQLEEYKENLSHCHTPSDGREIMEEEMVVYGNNPKHCIIGEQL